MRFIKVFFKMAHAWLFYPLMIGLFLWLYFKQAHWIFGLAVIVAILILDPIWRIMAGNMIKAVKNRYNR